MIRHPFTILKNFDSWLNVAMFTKEDGVISDQIVADKLHAHEYASLRQVHGDRCVIIDSPSPRIEEADAMATEKKQLALMIRSADCQTFLIAAPTKRVIAVVHAGWRGLKAHVLRESYFTLEKKWHILPGDTWVGMGPSLCQKCAEFSDPLRELESIPEKLIDGRNADLQGWADHQLSAIGVPRLQRERHPDCTRCGPDQYWTYRGGDRDAVLEGRTNVLAGVIRT